MQVAPILRIKTHPKSLRPGDGGSLKNYSEAPPTVATRLGFGHRFDKFVISLMASGCTMVHTKDL